MSSWTRSLSSSVLSTSTRNTVASGFMGCSNAGSGPRVTDIVPQSDDRFRHRVLVAEDAQARGSEEEEAPGRRLEPEPARGEHAQEVAAREEQHVAAGRAKARDD